MPISFDINHIKIFSLIYRFFFWKNKDIGELISHYKNFLSSSNSICFCFSSLSFAE